jgi:hypothetical protein
VNCWCPVVVAYSCIRVPRRHRGQAIVPVSVLRTGMRPPVRGHPPHPGAGAQVLRPRFPCWKNYRPPPGLGYGLGYHTGYFLCPSARVGRRECSRGVVLPAVRRRSEDVLVLLVSPIVTSW